jgi:Caudovirus prohead serine protease
LAAVLERVGTLRGDEPLYVVREVRRAQRGPGPSPRAPVEIEGYLTRFGSWHRLEDPVESRMLGLPAGQRSFVEQLARGALADSFTRHFSGGKRLQLLFEHGRDSHFGQKPLATFLDLGENEIGPYFRARLLRGASYVEDMLPAIRDPGQLAPSYSFRMSHGTLNRRPEPSDHNPEAIPEVTITRADVREISLVLWPADPASSCRVIEQPAAIAA